MNCVERKAQFASERKRATNILEHFGATSVRHYALIERRSYRSKTLLGPRTVIFNALDYYGWGNLVLMTMLYETSKRVYIFCLAALLDTYMYMVFFANI